MVNLTLKRDVRWQAPLPVWAENSSTGLRVTNEHLAPYPSILRFANDSFMEDMLTTLQHSPRRIGEWLVQPETWRQPMKTPDPVQAPRESNGLAFLLNRTHRLTAQRRPAAEKPIRLDNSRAMVIGDDIHAANVPVKLFQSSHQRYYLVSASLIANRPGLPDQRLNLAQQESASFVVRRLVPPSGRTAPLDGEPLDDLAEWDEYAYINTAAGARWQRVDRFDSQLSGHLQDNEDKLPLFPVGFADDCQHQRMLLNGLIPIGQREKWMGAPVAAQVSGADSGDGLEDSPISRAQLLFQTDVTEPWKILIEQAEFKQQGLARSFDGIEGSGNANAENDRARRTQRDIIQTASWYVLLDFAKFLQRELPAVWSVAQQLAANDALQVSDFELSADEMNLLQRIDDARLSNSLIDALLAKRDRYVPGTSNNVLTRRNAALEAGTVKRRLTEALVAVVQWEDRLEKVETAFMRFDEEAVDEDGLKPVALEVDPLWPDFLFPLADLQVDGPLPVAPADTSLESRLATLSQLAELVGAILPEAASTDTIVHPAGALSQRDGWFVIRCIYERPHCGPLYPALVSQPTRVFTMAPFFDPDAPARPVRIPMPLDISPAGLRKYQKNTAFVISDMLCGKIGKIRKMSFGDLVLSVLPWPFHKDLPNPSDSGPCKTGGLDFGMICSLSIPIVTLCALILLMIMVALFDLFFRWIPFLFLCLPIPGLKGKGSA